MVGRNVIVFVSASKDNPALPWESDSSIKGNTVYCVGWVDHIGPGTYSKYDWHLDPIVVLPLPVKVGAGVGMGHVSPGPSHMLALERVNAHLRTLAQIMPARGAKQAAAKGNSSGRTGSDGKSKTSRR